MEDRRLIDQLVGANGLTSDEAPRLNFSVMKRNPQHVWQPRLFQVDVVGKTIRNIAKDKMRTEFDFKTIEHAVHNDESPTSLTIDFVDKRQHLIRMQTELERDMFIKLCNDIANNRFSPADFSHDDIQHLPWWPFHEVRLEGEVEKKGTLHFDKRWARIVTFRIFIFRDDAAIIPLNTVCLLGTEVFKEGKAELLFETAHRSFTLRWPTAAKRDEWYDAIQDIQACNMDGLNAYVMPKHHHDK